MRTDKIVVDLETTGLNPTENEIIEIGALLVDADYNVKDVFHHLVKPNTKIKPFITDITDITNTMVADAPSFKELTANLTKFIEDKPIYSYSNFDQKFLQANCYMSNKFVDVLQITRRRYRSFTNHKLKYVCERFKISTSLHHSAFFDAAMLLKLMKAMRL